MAHHALRHFSRLCPLLHASFVVHLLLSNLFRHVCTDNKLNTHTINLAHDKSEFISYTLLRQMLWLHPAATVCVTPCAQITAEARF